MQTRAISADSYSTNYEECATKHKALKLNITYLIKSYNNLNSYVLINPMQVVLHFSWFKWNTIHGLQVWVQLLRYIMLQYQHIIPSVRYCNMMKQTWLRKETSNETHTRPWQSERNDRKHYKFRKLLRWIFYGVIANMAPDVECNGFLSNLCVNNFLHYC